MYPKSETEYNSGSHILYEVDLLQITMYMHFPSLTDLPRVDFTLGNLLRPYSFAG